MEKVGDRLITFAFTRPSETSRARKVNEFQGRLEKLKRTLRNLEIRRKDYLTKIDGKIEYTKEEIVEAEDHLLVLNSPEFQKWLDEQRMDEVQAYAKAEHFMREYLGLKVYARLMEQGELVFEVQEETWKITRYGLVYRKEGEQFNPVCVVRPKELPIPDFVVSALTTLKENPNAILEEQRR